jgi:hypothetical protein
MLSMALMEAFPGRRVYVSLRATRASLLAQVPWLEKIPPGQVEVIDTSAELDQVQDHTGGGSTSAALLTNHAEARDLSEFLWLPKAVQAAWSVTDPVRPTLMVFDSWDAVVDQYFERPPKAADETPSRFEVERLLLARMHRSNISLVLVLERDTPSVLDYQVTGLVETYRRTEEGRLERWLSLSKLRGVPIETDTYPFTLAHGRFAAITPTRSGHRYTLEAPAPDPNPEADGLWPGSTDFANGFGRLRFGAVTLLELDSAVPREISRVLLGPMIVQTLRLGGRVLVVPPPSFDPDDAYVGVRKHVAREMVRAQLRVISTIPLSLEPSDAPEVFVPFQRIGWTKSGPPVPLPEDPDFLEAAQDSRKPSMVIAYLSGLQALTQAANVPLNRGVLAAMARAVFPRSPTHVAVVARTGDPLFPEISPVSELHIRLRGPHGRIFLNGHRPYLAPLVLTQDNGVEPYHLAQIL